MEFALTRKQLNKKRAEAAAPAAVEHGFPTPVAAGGDPSWIPHVPGAPQGTGPRSVGDGVPPLLPEGFGRPAVAVPPAPAGPASPPPPPGVMGFDAPPPPPGVMGLDAPPAGAFVPERPSVTRLRVRSSRVPAGERFVEVVRRYVGVVALVAAIVAAALLVPAAHHSGSPSGAPVPSRSAATAVVR